MADFIPYNDGHNTLTRASLGLLCEYIGISLINHPLLINPPIKDPLNPDKQLLITNLRTYQGINIELSGLSLLIYPYARREDIINTTSNNVAVAIDPFELSSGEIGSYDKMTVSLVIELTYRGYAKETFDIRVPQPTGIVNGCILPYEPRELDNTNPNNFRTINYTRYPYELLLFDYIELIRLALTTDLRILTLHGLRLNSESHINHITPVSNEWTEEENIVLHRVKILWQLCVPATRFWNTQLRNVLYKDIDRANLDSIFVDFNAHQITEEKDNNISREF